MRIEPNSTIHLLKGFKIDGTYKHTLWFPNKARQYDFFENTWGSRITLNKYSYQRYNSGVIKVNKPVDELYGVNYMVFSNNAYGDKLFMAFVTDVTYLNNKTTLVAYEIDVIQTWMFDYETKPCFVIREHPYGDFLSDCLVPEDFAPTARVELARNTYLLDMNELYVVVMYNALVDLVDITNNNEYVKQMLSGYYSHQYAGVKFVAFPISQNNMPIIQDVLGTLDFGIDILGLYVVPAKVVEEYMIGGDQDVEDNERMCNLYAPLRIPKPTKHGGGYEPINKKLLTFPYISTSIVTPRGEGEPLAFEYFGKKEGDDSDDAWYDAYMGILPNTGIYICPHIYRNSAAPAVHYGIQSDPYPSGSFASDSLLGWLAKTCLELIPNVIGVGVNMITQSNAGTQVSSKVTEAIQENDTTKHYERGDNGRLIITNKDTANYNTETVRTTETTYTPKNTGKEFANITTALANASIGIFDSRGSMSGSGSIVNQARLPHQCYVCSKGLYEYEAKIFDDYFTMYGYATKRVKIPNKRVRNLWTYVKTEGYFGVPTGLNGVPSGEMSKISKIHDAGITYWYYTADVGNYARENAILNLNPIPWEDCEGEQL